MKAIPYSGAVYWMRHSMLKSAISMVQHMICITIETS